MAFLRFTRDKRGYEHFYLVQPTTNRRGKVRTRILYWFRTPPNVKVGREPFDESLRRALEAQNPDVAFDWKKIVETPIPSADAEKWRERRRLERAERAARVREAEAEPGVDADIEDAEEATEETGIAADAPEAADQEPSRASADAVEQPSSEVVEATAGQPLDRRRRRRRRRGKRGRPPESHEPQ